MLNPHWDIERAIVNESGRFTQFCFAAMLLVVSAAASEVAETSDVAPVWSGHPVEFCLLTRPPNQFVAYYDAGRRMTVSARALGAPHWQSATLPEMLGWDSHNYVTLAIDDAGCLHLSGNMHVMPLKYYRTEKPLDITSFTRVLSMTGQREDRVTYPRFLSGPRNELIYTYRDGQSGAGSQIYNVYEPNAKTWRRLIDSPLVDGQGKANPYFDGPVRGPDGYFHLCWVWRDTPDCATNHDVCYARSKDLVHWESSQGKPFDLPITMATAEIVDPAPAHGGLLNGNVRIGFDTDGRCVISYHKFDESGITQLYNARTENGPWRIRQSSHWEYRWDFSGPGAIVTEIVLEPVVAGSDGTLRQAWTHVRYGSQCWRLDPKDLAPLERLVAPPSPIPPQLQRVESSFPGMEVHFANDSGASGNPHVRYLLRWETLAANRDRPRDEPWPPPSMLRVYRVLDYSS